MGRWKLSCWKVKRKQALLWLMLAGLACLCPTVGRAGERSWGWSAGNLRPLPSPLAGDVVATDPSRACEDAIGAAELRYDLPHGLLLAIGMAESGHRDPRTGALKPWPWTVQAEGTGRYFPNNAEAVGWVRGALARGVSSIDTGCMQINLQYHSAAFRSIEEAFDVSANVDYAARFLLRLHATASDWSQAIGFYHSRTPSYAEPYRRGVERFMTVSMSMPHPVRTPTTARLLAAAWASTLPASQAPPGGTTETRVWGIAPANRLLSQRAHYEGGFERHASGTTYECAGSKRLGPPGAGPYCLTRG